jgi:peptide/nickel transport system permease protein
MATLELRIREDVTVRSRRLGLLFWLAIGWIILIFAVAITCRCAAVSEPDRHGHAGEEGAIFD